MDATTTRRPQLPALSYLDVDKIKREDDVATSRVTSSPSGAVASAMTTSPSYYPPGPPPPYNYSSAHNGGLWPTAAPAVHTPPESRHTSGDDVDNAAKQAPRQSLPSISEALGVDRQPILSHPSTTMPPPSPSIKTYMHSFDATNAGLAQGHHRSNSNTTQEHSKRYREDSKWPDILAAKEPGPPSLPPVLDHSPLRSIASQPLAHSMSLPPAPLPATISTPLIPFPSPAASHTYESSASSHPPMPPAPVSGLSSTFSHGYTPYNARFREAQSDSGPLYRPSTSGTPSVWAADHQATKHSADGRQSLGLHSESVKRHLDTFDLEAALNDIASSSGILLDFTRRYGDRLHQTARTGPELASLPGLIEVDDMIAKARLQMDGLVKIRDVVITQQAAYEQQAADHRQRLSLSQSSPTSADHISEGDDSKNAFMGQDAKKRRGRAAPPGRCHSCNRAETPEWRRGPDGARTLCNACGLHYAKLTRKQQSAGKNASVGSSNLRTKAA